MSPIAALAGSQSGLSIAGGDAPHDLGMEGGDPREVAIGDDRDELDPDGEGGADDGGDDLAQRRVRLAPIRANRAMVVPRAMATAAAASAGDDGIGGEPARPRRGRWRRRRTGADQDHGHRHGRSA